MTNRWKRQNRAALRMAAVFAAAVVVVSCGYRFSGGGPLPGGVRRVYVPMLKNVTRETGLESIVTNALRYEIVRSGNDVAADGQVADAVLSGEITGAVSETIARQTVGTAIERRVRLTAVLELKSGDADRSLWARRAMSATETYDVVSDRTTTDDNRRRALEAASRRLAEKALASIADDF